MKKGILIELPKNSWDSKLKDLVCEADRPQFEEILVFCVEQNVSAVILFVNLRNEYYTCVGYIPIYEDESVLKKCADKFKNFERSIFLGAYIVDDIDELKDYQFMEFLKKRALRHAFWQGDYGIMVIS